MEACEIKEKLDEISATRGGRSHLAQSIGVSKSTVTRWADGGTITPSHKLLLSLYFSGNPPFTPVNHETIPR